MYHKAWLLVVFVFAVSGSALAQSGDTALLGFISDPQQRAVAGARLEATHIETNVVYTTTTNEVGLYRFITLPVGVYRITVGGTPGFRSEIRNGIVLRVGDHIQLNFQLQLGAEVQSVEVTGAAPLVDTADAVVGNVIGNEQMRNLPLNGRNAMTLVLLTPNVNSVAVSPSGFTDRGLAVSALSINGGVAAMNNILVDGSTNVSVRLGDQSVNPLVDAVEEFKVQSGPMSAEYGYTGGGVISIALKSGTNTFHGNLYEFLRNDLFDARTTFAATKAPFRYNQFGGVLGGPIIKNKTFFFFNYEDWEYHQAYTALGTVPTSAQRQGNFSQLRDASGNLIPIYDTSTTTANPSGNGYIRNPFPGNIIPSSELDKVAQNILTYYPLPNQAPNNSFTQTNNFQANSPAVRRAEAISLKIDHHFSSTQFLSGHYMYWDHHDDQASQGNSYFADSTVRDRYDIYRNTNIAINDTKMISPHLVNDIRLAYIRLYFTYQSAAYGKDMTAKLGLPSNVPDITLPVVTIPGIQTFPGGYAMYDGINGEYRFQLMDALTWNKGKHSLKLGFDIQRNLYSLNACTNCSGSFTFNTNLTGNPLQLAGTGSGIASFLLGAVASASGEADLGYSYLNLNQAYYFQDDWKVSRRLTLNLGLRYDHQQVPAERNKGISRFNPSATDPVNGLLGAMEYGATYGGAPQTPDYNDFGPRFGFALDIFGDGRTALRGGYGMYYPLSFENARLTSRSGFSNTTTYSPPGGNTNLPAFMLQNGFPSPEVPPLGAALGPSAFLSQNVAFDESSGRSPYSQQFSLLLQHQLSGTYVVQVGFSGNKGTKLPAGNYNYNQLDPKYQALGNALLNTVPNPYSGIVPGVYGGSTITEKQSLLPYPYYGTISVSTPHMASSTYDSFVANVEKRMSAGLQLLASYTFGKLLDDGFFGFNQSGTENVNILTYQNGKYDRKAERSVDSNDVPSRFVLSAVYEFPVGAGKAWQPSNRVISGLLGGWQTNGVLTLQSGIPVVISGANNNIATRPNSSGISPRLDHPGAQEWFDTSQFVNPPNWTFGNVSRTLPDVFGPGIQDVDFSLFRTFRLRERFNLQFRAETFNLFNHANLLQPNGTFVPAANGQNGSGTFGTISTSSTARNIQFALRLTF